MASLKNIPAKHIPIAEKGYVLLVDEFFSNAIKQKTQRIAKKLSLVKRYACLRK
ncbi:MAG: hypothetical protein QF560_02070 [SAR324 cluster bacterium]|jgi:hypothetical protein|nr:hypothetical protein [SAR324 cluster bacterium]MDP6247692.1 hypothetical protein [SAR324 cluster bacterium]MDP6463268.1 hypothetical protein [SAR324 cluster bacterium]MDP6637915.1 hypothetical protein [SAR324 cluster bacterium]MDP7137144.1 hypothetical protein [SAR324 cluster bacterium]|tara:strand:+ start:5770 stop:5931 length:162 start_codon:yes stop_codon:yes gene_type:complete